MYKGQDIITNHIYINIYSRRYFLSYSWQHILGSDQQSEDLSQAI